MTDSEFGALWDSIADEAGRVGQREFRALGRPDAAIPRPPTAGGETRTVSPPPVTATVTERVMCHWGSVERGIATLDPDAAGDVSLAQLKLMLKSCKCNLTEAELREFTAALDKRGSGRVTLSALQDKVLLLVYVCERENREREGGPRRRAGEGLCLYAC